MNCSMHSSRSAAYRTKRGTLLCGECADLEQKFHPGSVVEIATGAAITAPISPLRRADAPFTHTAIERESDPGVFDIFGGDIVEPNDDEYQGTGTREDIARNSAPSMRVKFVTASVDDLGAAHGTNR